MGVHVVENKPDFDEKLRTNAKVVVDFYATWCGPCKAISPFLEELSNNPDYSDVLFIKIDVDVAEDVSEHCGISAMPTFHFYHNGSKFDELVGASKDKLKSLLDKLKSQ